MCVNGTMPDRAYLGIDTSCYTTSVALVGENGRLLRDERQLLPVPAGEHGLRQSDGVFHHVRQIPALLQKLQLHDFMVQAVGVSARPRPVEGSYMPVFLPGVAVAEAVAEALGVSLYHLSHQEGHISAGLSGEPLRNRVMAVHLSGGTSEVMLVEPQGEGFHVELLGGTNDLSAGQMIDRVGVALGLPFPAGPAMEQQANGAIGSISLPSAAQGYEFSFSGPCSAALRLVEEQAAPAEIAFAVLRVVANSLEKTLRHAADETGVKSALLVGGVVSNLLIRKRLQKRMGPGYKLQFAPVELASDNAAGIAWLARRHHLAEQGRGD